MGWHDDYVLDGPKFPVWGCNKCGASQNSASRIKCRCGADAATRIVQAVKREASAAKLRPKATPKRASQPADKRDEELVELRAELSKLRADTSAPSQQAGDASMGDEPVDVDIDKVQSVYDATVAAYGKESVRAKDSLAELEGLREARQQARPLSGQLRYVERRVAGQRKTLEVARTTAAKLLKQQDSHKLLFMTRMSKFRSVKGSCVRQKQKNNDYCDSEQPRLRSFLLPHPTAQLHHNVSRHLFVILETIQKRCRRCKLFVPELQHENKLLSKISLRQKCVRSDRLPLVLVQLRISSVIGILRAPLRMGLKSYVCNMPEKLFGAFCPDFSPGWLFDLVHTSFITFLRVFLDIDSSVMGIVLDRYVCNMPVE